MSFKLFLEATGDHKVDSFLSRMVDRNRGIRGSVTKIRSDGEDLVADEQMQRELERWMKNELIELEQLPEKELRHIRPKMKVLLDENGSGSLVLPTLFVFSTDYLHNTPPIDDPLRTIADAVIHEYSAEINQALNRWLTGFGKLAGEASKKDWPTGKDSWKQRSVSAYTRKFNDAKDTALHIRAVLRHAVDN